MPAFRVYEISNGMGIYDAMKLCKVDASTICMGLAASVGAFLLASGSKGKRYCMPNTRVMIHQPLGMGIYDAMKLCKTNVSIILIGLVTFMGAFLLGFWQSRKEILHAKCKVMIHQPLRTAGVKLVKIRQSSSGNMCLPCSIPSVFGMEWRKKMERRPGLRMRKSARREVLLKQLVNLCSCLEGVPDQEEYMAKYSTA
ncbi:hypothetical protein ACH5RR_011644 [Cinchona calisaya]|uniref:ATP-dependent Clp protease proteolytic subunit n=1 Tax=Cinchona calisaya TaxID=153742 RepID=A0ABD3A717_9GENT